MRGLRSFLLSTILAAVLVLISLPAQAPAAKPVAATDANAQLTGSLPLPGVGTTTETCAGGTSAGCSRWLGSGPVNVVLLSRSAESPYADALQQTKPGWASAQGGWLAARLPTRGCGVSWKTSASQIELRLDAATRRHMKFIDTGCSFQGYHLTVGEAHTDLYERRRCGGDHIADLDLARDALVTSLVAGGGVTRVEYRSWREPGTTFPDGCGGRVATDGRVAYLWLQT
jgi:hypothetical protein